MQIRRFLRVLVMAALVLTLSAVIGCSGDDGSGNGGGGYGGGQTPQQDSNEATTIVERNLAFDPSRLEVSVGDTVTFVNEDSAPHQVSIDGKQLETQNQGDEVTWKAEKSGTYQYTCTIHPSMTGEVVVK